MGAIVGAGVRLATAVGVRIGTFTYYDNSYYEFSHVLLSCFVSFWPDTFEFRGVGAATQIHIQTILVEGTKVCD